MQEATAITAYPAEFVGLIRTTQLDKAKVDAILAEFRTAISIEDVEAQARAIVVTDASQTDLMKQARELRLSLKNERVSIDKTRKALKESAKREVDLIDGIGRILREKIEPIEAHLQEQEDFAARQEAERLNARRIERVNALAPYVENANVYDLFSMSDEAFAELLLNSQTAYQAKEEAARIAEENRIADQKRRDEEAEQLRIENERLAAEKAEADKKAADERAAREKAEAELKRQETEKREAEQKAEAEARALALAPDKEKLLAYADRIAAVRSDIPIVSSEFDTLISYIHENLGRVIRQINDTIALKGM